MTGVEVKEWREKRGLSRARLAELLPVSLRTLEGWETGKGQPAPYIVRALNDLEGEIKEKGQTPYQDVKLVEVSFKGDEAYERGAAAERSREKTAHLDAVAPPAGQGKATVETYQPLSQSVVKRLAAQRPAKAPLLKPSERGKR